MWAEYKSRKLGITVQSTVYIDVDPITNSVEDIWFYGHIRRIRIYLKTPKEGTIVCLHIIVDHKLLEKRDTWIVEKPEKLTPWWCLDIREKVMRNVKNMVKLALKPEIREKVSKLKSYGEPSHLTKPGYHLKVGEYYLYRGSEPTDFSICFMDYDEKVRNGFKVILYFRPLEIPAEYYFPKLGSILDSIVKFLGELLSGKPIGEVGKVVEYYDEDEGRSFVVWNIIDGKVISAHFNEKPRSPRGEYERIRELTVSYVRWQDYPRYRRNRKLLLKEAETWFNTLKATGWIHQYEVMKGDIGFEIYLVKFAQGGLEISPTKRFMEIGFVIYRFCFIELFKHKKD